MSDVADYEDSVHAWSCRRYTTHLYHNIFARECPRYTTPICIKIHLRLYRNASVAAEVVRTLPIRIDTAIQNRLRHFKTEHVHNIGLARSTNALSLKGASLGVALLLVAPARIVQKQGHEVDTTLKV